LQNRLGKPGKFIRPNYTAFIRAKQLAAESGLAYGWEPFQLSDGPVAFSGVRDAGELPNDRCCGTRRHCCAIN
jgi:hypothetical protein